MFSRVGLSQYKVVESVTVAFVSKVPLKIHLAFPKPNSIKFFPFTKIWVNPDVGPQIGLRLAISGLSKYWKLSTSDSNLSFSYLTTNFVSPALVVFGERQVKWVLETTFAFT